MLVTESQDVSLLVILCNCLLLFSIFIVVEAKDVHLFKTYFIFFSCII